MAFRVEISPLALANIEAAYRYLKRESPEYASKWLNGMIASVLSLEKWPKRCRVVEESKEVGLDIRALLYGKRHEAFKIFFSIQKKTPDRNIVCIFHVRHAARRWLLPNELRAFL